MTCISSDRLVDARPILWLPRCWLAILQYVFLGLDERGLIPEMLEC
jgi:hypothetical protein